MAKEEPLSRQDETGDDDPPTRSPNYSALKVKQNKHTFYVLTVPVGDLLPYCYAVRIDEDLESGFQRHMAEARADDIADYLRSGEGSLPGNIVLSAKEPAEMEYDGSAKGISFLRVKNAFLIIDGQHRLWGYAKAGVDFRVPVSIYEGLSSGEEIRLFITINNNQRGVSQSMIDELKCRADLATPEEMMLREFYQRFGEDKTSPLFGKVSNARPMSGKPSLRTFHRALSPLLSSPTLASLAEAKRYSLLLGYLKGFAKALTDKTLLNRAAFFEAAFEPFDDLVRATKERFGRVKAEHLAQMFAPLASVDFRQLSPRPNWQAYTRVIRGALLRGTRISQDDIDD